MFANSDIKNKILETNGEDGEACKNMIKQLQKILQPTSQQEHQLYSHSPTPGQMIDFLEYGYKIKETQRRGWIRKGIQKSETVACHMYRMALMAMVLPSAEQGLDQLRCIKLALIHDLAEAIVGDITPDCGISQGEKHSLEMEAMGKIVATMEGSQQANMIMDLFKEYEEGNSAESRRVHEIDKLELALQAMEYERKYRIKLDCFVETALNSIKSEDLKSILDLIIKKRPPL